jgi:F-type H+-transporting ATPase subunit b
MLLAPLLLAAEETPPPLIDVDGTLFVQFGLFLLMLLVLSRLVFRPYLKMRDDRDKGIAGAKHEAEEMVARASKILSDYDAQLGRTRQRGADERARLRGEGAVRERQLLGAAREEAQRALEAARDDIRGQAHAARTQLDTEAAALARQMARKVLGREVA